MGLLHPQARSTHHDGKGVGGNLAAEPELFTPPTQLTSGIFKIGCRLIARPGGAGARPWITLQSENPSVSAVPHISGLLYGPRRPYDSPSASTPSGFCG